MQSGREEGSVTWVGAEGEEVGGREGGRLEAHQGTEWQQESPKGEGPVYQLPCPHSPFNKPDLMSVCLSYIYIYMLIDILAFFVFSLQENI